MLASGVIGGTLAYLTDTGDATNTFTLGKIDVDITEPNWDPTDGEDIVPGDTYDKDPTITANEGDSYMRVKMEIIDSSTGLPIGDTETARRDLILAMIRFDSGAAITAGTPYSLADLAAIPTISSDFVYDATRGNVGVRYYTFDDADDIFSADDSDSAVLFTNIVVPTDYDNDDFLIIGNFQIKLTVEAIQSDNVTDAAAAYTLMDTEFPL